MMSDDDSVYCLCWYIVIFSYFLLSPPRRMVVLTCASGRLIASYQARYIRAEWMIRGGGVWSVKLIASSLALLLS